MAESDTIQRHVRLPARTADRLDAIAEREGRSVSMQMVYFLTKAVAEYERRNGGQLVKAQEQGGQGETST